MQFYVPLLDEFEIVAVTPRWQPNKRTYDGIPQAPLVSLDQVIGAIPLLQKSLDTLVRLRSENLYYFFGLEKLLASAAIVECLETFHPYCWQALRGKGRFGYRLAFSCHENIAFAHENLKIRRQIKQDAFHKGDAFFALCEQGRNSLILEGAPADRIFLSGMAIDTDLYSPGTPDSIALAPLGIDVEKPKSEPVVLFAGRMVWEKGIFDVIEAVGLLHHQNFPVQLLLAGDGPESAKVADRLQRMGITNIVRRLGRVSQQQMVALYRYADACLVPSIPTAKWQEQFGCVLIEAMGCGCPVLATDSGAIREVTGGYATLIPPAQHTYLAQSLRELLSDPQKRQTVAQAAREWVVRQYANSVNANRIRAVYRGMLSGEIAAETEQRKVVPA
jgi:glycosyltransferase involved in cell wall biosynthesis